MAGENVVGELSVLLTGKDAGASAAIDKVKGKAEGATGSLDKLGASALKAQGVIAKLMMPVALATSIAGAVRLIVQFADESRRAKEELDALGSSMQGSVAALIQSRREFSETTKEGIAFLNESRKASEALNDQYENGLSWVEKMTFALKGGRDENDKISRAAQEITDRYIEAGNAQSRSFITAQKLLKADRDRAAIAAEIAESAQKIADLSADAEARYSKIAELNGIIQAAKDAQLDADEKAYLNTLRQIEALENMLNAGPLQEGVAAKVQAAIDAIAEAQIKADKKVAAEKAKAEADLQAQRLRDLDDFNRAIRDSLAGGVFGAGAVAGGGVAEIVAALGQIANNTSGAR